MEEQRKITKKYSNGEVTVVWQPHLCIHSTICFRGLPNVFDPRKRPWITPENADSEVIMKQIDSCPSGALTYMRANIDQENAIIDNETIVETTQNGPLLVYGNISIKDSSGNLTKKHKVTALCRCGASKNKPFCDGSHLNVNFEG
ncbi:(4Fe-4S)-binding protein [Emticicia sp.]|uniref:(4Fe-4S)-binding protein n=1 Tax=Emticicia sp. TaxID=1930953 RepID=UPI003750E4CD